MKKDIVLKWLSYVFLIATPFLAIVIQSLYFKTNIFNFHPVFHDECVYWREVYSFINCGLNTGYIGEREGAPRLLAFGTHGPFPALFYGFFSLFIGWRPNGVLLSNTIFTTLCFLFFIVILKPKSWQALGLSALYFLFFPSLIYSRILMTETINYGFFIIYITFLVKSVIAERNNLVYFFICLLIVIVMRIYRQSYLVLFIPPIVFFPLVEKTKFRICHFIILFLSLIVICCLVKITLSAMFSPYDWNPLSQMSKIIYWPAKIQFFWNHAYKNFQVYFSMSKGEECENVLRFLNVFVIAIYALIISISRELKTKLIAISCFLVLLIMWFINITAYDVIFRRDFRVLSPFVFAALSVPFLCNIKKRFLWGIFILLFFCDIACFNNIYLTESQIRLRTAELGEKVIFNNLKFNAESTNRFENTVVYNQNFDLFKILYNIPPNFGVSYVSKGNENEIKKCRFVITKQILNSSKFIKLEETPIGFLYERID